jgi:hypothetical protein
MPTKEAVYIENTKRMRRFNREWSYNRYWGFRPPPMALLLHEDGIDRRYAPSPATLPQDDQIAEPVGREVDRHDYYDVLEPDYHAPGDIWQTREGRTFVLVETPAEDGGWRRKWIQVG